MDKVFFCEPDICEFLYRRNGLSPITSHTPQMLGRGCQESTVFVEPSQLYFTVASALQEAVQEKRATDVIASAFSTAMYVSQNLWSPVEVIRDVDRFLRNGDKSAFGVYNAACNFCNKYIPENQIPLYECHRANCSDCIISDVSNLPMLVRRIPQGSKEVFISSTFNEYTYGILPYLAQIDKLHIVQKIQRSVAPDYYTRSLSYFLNVSIKCPVVCEEA